MKKLLIALFIAFIIPRFAAANCQTVECFRENWHAVFSELSTSRTVSRAEFENRSWKRLGIQPRDNWYGYLQPYLKMSLPDVSSVLSRFADLQPAPGNKYRIDHSPAVPEAYIPALRTEKPQVLFNIFQYDLDREEDRLRLEAFLREESVHFDGSDRWTQEGITEIINVLRKTFSHSIPFYQLYKPWSYSYGCGELSKLFGAAIHKAGFNVSAVSPGSHTVLRLQINGTNLIVDLTIWQYSGLNLPLVTTRRTIIADTEAQDNEIMQGFQIPWYIGYVQPAWPVIDRDFTVPFTGEPAAIRDIRDGTTRNAPAQSQEITENALSIIRAFEASLGIK